VSAETHDEGPVRGLTIALAGVAALGIETALAQPAPPSPAGLGAAVGLTAAAGLTLWLLRKKAGGSLALAALVVLCAVDLVRVVRQYELPLELTMFVLFRNVALVLAALSARPVLLRCVGGLSAALVLGAACLVEDRAGIVLVSAFGVAGSLWLCFLYWGQVRRDLLPGAARRLPLASAALLWMVLAGALTFAAVGPRRALAALGELVPSSGGMHGYDPNARGGVNDGDAVTAGQNQPRSAGMVQSDIFLDSDERSLYDAANEFYGPPRKVKYRQKAVAISAKEVQHAERVEQNRQVSRPFPLERQRPATAPSRLRKHDSDAQFFVKGSTPLHLRLVAYSGITREALEEAPPPSMQLALRKEAGGWLMLPDSKADIFAGNVRHEIKLSRLEARQLVAPAHVAGLRIDQVDRQDLFRWAQEGILAMADGKMPAGVVIEYESRTVDPKRLHTSGSGPQCASTLPVYRDTTSVSAAVRELATSWASEAPAGWRRVEAIVSRLRTGYTNDRGATVPEECNDAMAHFLLESHRGPDFLFATSAAALVRVLGYPTRVAWGFYARPDRYDPATGHTPVLEEDLHFWAEVWQPGDEWVIIEPTPGYDQPAPCRPWWQHCLAAVSAAGTWSREHPGTLALMTGGFGVLYWRRRAVADRLATLLWHLRSGAPPRQRVLATLALLERRACRAGFPRPASRTARAWYGTLNATAPKDPDKGLNRFVELADWATYAPVPHWPRLPRGENDVRQTCRHAVERWDLRYLRRLAMRR
jgi:protein-glutamine gamma-glutamyltransferase